MSVDVAVEVCFAIVALLGLVAAKRPAILIKYFLAESQSERALANIAALKRTGWIIFAFSAFIVAAMLAQSASR